MNYSSITTIEQRVKALAEIINAPDDAIPTFGFTTDTGLPHIEVGKYGYHYIVVERGREFERKSTFDLQTLLYWIFRDVTFSMAAKFELENRIPDQDFRALLFKKQVELISKIDLKFGESLRIEIDQLLIISPFINKPDESVGLK